MKNPMKLAALLFSVSCGLILAAYSVESLPGQAKQYQASTADGQMSPDSKFISVNGIRIHYLEWGRGGSHILLLHGLNGDARPWTDLAPILASEYQVLALDRRGAGESDKPIEGYDFQTLADDIAAFSMKLNLGRVILVGNSFGAQLALMTAAKKPDLVSSVILIDGGFWPKKNIAANPSPSSEIEKTIREYDPETVYPDIRVPVLMIIARGSAPGADVIAQLKEKGIDYFEEIKKAERGAKELADRKLIHGEIAIIEDTSHNVQVDQPKKLAETIKQFLSKVASIQPQK